MVVRQETRPGTGAGETPPEFRAAVASMRAARLRPEVFCEEMPAPQRIAPHSFALSADGKYLYVATDRPGGKGGLDLYGVAVIEIEEIK